MRNSKLSTRAAIAGAALLSALLLASSPSTGASDQPFPYDPLCRWGRLSDGKGFLIRCLTKQDTESLRNPKAPQAQEASEVEGLEVVLGPITAESGSFPKGVQSLNKGQTKYQACMKDHGGISAKEGRVEVRFLVRGRGRAEGAVAKKHSGMSEAAAKCIADVVDRRFVGYPDQEIVGATLVVTVKKQSK